jgi:alkylation response protein AidB-like acyl-CoA dehydrogenase
VPESLGGLEADPVSYMIAMEYLAECDNIAAWQCQVQNGAAAALAKAPASMAERIWGTDPDVLFCNSFNKPLHADKVPGGYVLNGRNGFNSGCRYASLCGAVAQVHDDGQPVTNEDGTPVVIATMFDISHAQIINNWDSLGMRASNSEDVLLEDVFVPEEHTTVLFDASRIHNRHCQGPLYRCPFGIVATVMAPITLGTLKTALDEFAAIVDGHMPMSAPASLKHKEYAQRAYSQTLATYRAERAYMMEAVGTAWSATLDGAGWEHADSADLFLAGTHVSQSCADAMDLLVRAAGSAAIYRTSRIERARRDLDTMKLHAWQSESRYASVSQIYWGLACDFPMYEMD